MKTLLIDIETSPNTAFVWGLFNENIPLARLIDSSEVLCFAAKWIGEDNVIFSSIMEESPREMIAKAHALLGEADVVIHYNGNRFDLPILNREFVILGFPPPAPYKSIDLLNTVRRKFRFVSNKLDYVCDKLGLGKKHDTDFKLWIDCMNKDPVAWRKMKEYNIQDSLLLEKLFNVIRPWIPNFPNYGLYQEDALVCPSCGSWHYQKRGTHKTNACTYQRYQCMDCYKWFRDGKNIGPKVGEKFIGVSA